MANTTQAEMVAAALLLLDQHQMGPAQVVAFGRMLAEATGRRQTMQRRPGLRYSVQFDTACAVSTANHHETAQRIDDAKQFMDGLPRGGRQSIPAGHLSYIWTSAKNAAGETLIAADVIEFNKAAERWCETHCTGDWDTFTSDAADADAAAFAKEFRGRRNRHPTKREQTTLLGREGRFDLAAQIIQEKRGAGNSTNGAH